MAEDGKIVYKVVVDKDGAVTEAENAGQEVGKKLEDSAKEGGGAFKEIMIGAARHIGEAFVSMAADAGRAVVDTMKAAVESVASLEQNVGGVETLFGDAADTVIENAKQAYETAGLSANQYMETVTSFSASLLQSLGGDTVKAAEYADMAIRDMSDNANKMGTDMQSIQNAYQGFAKQNYTMLDNLKLGYGGTKTEMERLVADAEKLDSTFKATRDENGKLVLSYSDVVDAIHIVQDNMGITGTTAKEASETIEGSMNAAKAAYDNFLNGSTSGEEFAETIITAAHNIADNVVTIAEQLGSELPGLVEKLGKEIPDLARQVGPPLFEVVKTLLSTLTGMLIEGLPDMLDAGISLLEEVLNGITTALPEAIPVIVEVIGKILESIATHLPEIVVAGIDLLNALLTGIVKAIPTLVDEMPKIVSALGRSIIEHLPEILEAGIKLVGAIISGVTTAAIELLRLFPEYVSSIVQIFKETNWGEVGSNIVSGIWEGIQSLWGDLVDFVTRSADDLWTSVKGFFGIHSPSTKFKYIGEMSVEGTKEGFEEGQADLVRTVRMIYEDVGDSASESLTAAAFSPDFFSTGALARAVSYDMSTTRSVYNNGGAVYYINVNGIEQLDEIVSWYNTRDIRGRMA